MSFADVNYLIAIIRYANRIIKYWKSKSSRVFIKRLQRHKIIFYS